MLRTVFAALLLATTAQALSIEADPDFPAFKDFIGKYGRRYATRSEFEGRFIIFKDNLKEIAARNEHNGARHGINQFADVDADEFRAQRMGFQPTSLKLKRKPGLPRATPINATAAKSKDWRNTGVLTPVKDQGQCGSCWAFSATEQLESQYQQQFGSLIELSPQQLVSCDPNCGGCNGGNPINAWFYVNNFGGQETEKAYPYTSGTTQASGTCNANAEFDAEAIGADVGYYVSQSASDEGNMLLAIQDSPLSIAVDASTWSSYTGGVVSASSGCGSTLNHAVQLVGYNAEGNYYIVRNSWGTSWGNGGYIYVEAGHNVCGIAGQAAVTVPSKIASLHKALRG